jgi:hypothetical protein
MAIKYCPECDLRPEKDGHKEGCPLDPEAIKAFWEYVEKTAKQVDAWPQWKKEGWAVLDKVPDVSGE